MSFVHKSREKVNYKTEDDIKKLDALANKKPNQGILAHERKRMIELKCLEMQELMEDQGRFHQFLLRMACERKLLESEATTGFFVLLGTKGKKETLEWCVKANLIASRYECSR
ncbi:hypothetical protein TNCV_1090971 [Trichonephila clavipes]|uniref:CWF21 domain-containing protein n=1 Tax=Trichonephila clavipes TaxID=2585209 RepID=A0A8X6SP65_TRICX|nr:hypothetical protein TNCV_1090971 [Trichonephila clavipes]